MPDIIAFLRARYAEVLDGSDSLHFPGCHVAAHTPFCNCGWERHRNLRRDIEVKRKLLDEHSDNGPRRRGEDGTLVRSGPVGDRCWTCVDDGTLVGGVVREFTEMAAWPCTTVRLLASEWDTHEDYRAEWRP